jgi:hypothetical protein
MADDVDAIHAAAPGPLAVALRLGLEPARGSTDRRCRVLCPWHSEKRPSCIITTKDGRIVAYCFSFRTGGDLLSLIAAVNGLDVKRDFREVIRIASDSFGVSLAERNRRQPTDPILLAREIDAAADAYGRGLDVRSEVIERSSPIEREQAFKILKKHDQRRIERSDHDAHVTSFEAEMDRRLDAVGDQLESAGRLEWRPR